MKTGVYNSQFTRFVIAGGIAALANLGSKVILQTVLGYNMSIIVAYLIGITVAYLTNIAFVFQSNINYRRVEIFTFFTYNLLMIPCVVFITTAFDAIFNYYFHTSEFYFLSHLLGVSAPTIISFIFHKKITFRAKK
mgnify:CR=1 FL=1